MSQDLYSVIADGTRRQILAVLSRGSSPVGGLVEVLGVSQPTVSKHLRVLREAGLVTMQAQGQRRFYSIEPGPLDEVSRWIAGLGGPAGQGSGTPPEEPAPVARTSTERAPEKSEQPPPSAPESSDPEPSASEPSAPGPGGPEPGTPDSGTPEPGTPESSAAPAGQEDPDRETVSVTVLLPAEEDRAPVPPDPVAHPATAALPVLPTDPSPEDVDEITATVLPTPQQEADAPEDPYGALPPPDDPGHRTRDKHPFTETENWVDDSKAHRSGLLSSLFRRRR